VALVVVLISWMTIGPVIGSDIRFLVLSALFWSLLGTIVTFVGLRERAGGPARTVSAARTQPAESAGTSTGEWIPPVRRRLEAEL
jgi:hypothetical protein